MDVVQLAKKVYDTVSDTLLDREEQKRKKKENKENYKNNPHRLPFHFLQLMLLRQIKACLSDSWLAGRN